MRCRYRDEVLAAEETKVSWRTNADYFASLGATIKKTESILKYYGGRVATFKERLESADPSLMLEEISAIASSFRVETRDYKALVEEVMERLEKAQVAMDAALHGGKPRGADQQHRLRMRREYSPRVADARTSNRKEDGSSSTDELEDDIQHTEMSRESASRILRGDSDSNGKSESAVGVTVECTDVLRGMAGDGEQLRRSTAGWSRTQTVASSDVAGSEAAIDVDVSGEEESPVKSAVTQYLSTSSSPFLSTISDDEVDCEDYAAIATAAAAAESTEKGNGNTSVTSTASLTAEGWVPWGYVDVGEFDKNSPRSVLHELRRQHELLHGVLSRHVAGLRRVSTVSSLLRESLLAAAAEVDAARSPLLLCASALCVFSWSVWQDRPLVPPSPAAAAAPEPRRLPAAPESAGRRILWRVLCFLLCLPRRR